MNHRLLPVLTILLAFAAGCGTRSPATKSVEDETATAAGRLPRQHFGPVSFRVPAGFVLANSSDGELLLEDRERMLLVHCTFHTVPNDNPGEVVQLKKFASGYTRGNSNLTKLHGVTLMQERASGKKYVASDMEMGDGLERTRARTLYLPIGRERAVFLQMTTALAVTEWDRARTVFQAIENSLQFED